MDFGVGEASCIGRLGDERFDVVCTHGLPMYLDFDGRLYVNELGATGGADLPR